MTRLPAQGLRHVAVHDALGQALDDRGLADAGLADQHRVVLGAPGQDLDGLLDLVGPADHRVDLAAPGQLGQVDAVLLERRGVAAARRGLPRPGPPGWRLGAAAAPAGSSRPASSRPAAESGLRPSAIRMCSGPDVGRADRAGDLQAVQQRALGRRGQRDAASGSLARRRRRPGGPARPAGASGSAPARRTVCCIGSCCRTAQSRWSVSRSAIARSGVGQLGGPAGGVGEHLAGVAAHVLA